MKKSQNPRPEGVRRMIVHAASAGLFAALIAVGALISLPVANGVTFSLQLLFVLLAAGLLPVYDSAAATVVYLLLGLVGLPVFAGGKSGVPALIGPTGGFIIGFIPAVLAAGGLSAVLRRSKMPEFPKACLSFTLGTVVCYLCGWVMMYFYMPEKGVGFAAKLAILPYIPFDAVKIAAAALITCRVKPYSDRLFVGKSARRAEAAADDRTENAIDDRTKITAGDRTENEAGDRTENEAGDRTESAAGDRTESAAGDRTKIAADDRTENEAKQ